MHERYTPPDARGERGREEALREVPARSKSLLDRYQHSSFGQLLVGLSFALSLEACGGAVQIGPGKVKSEIPDLGRVTVTASPDMGALFGGKFAGSIGITFQEGREHARVSARQDKPMSVEEKYKQETDLGAIVPDGVLKKVKKLTDTAGQ